MAVINGKTRYISTITGKNRGLKSQPTEDLGVLKNSMKRVCAFEIELEFESVGFSGEGKPEDSEKNLSEQWREPTTNSTHIWRIGMVWKYRLFTIE